MLQAWQHSLTNNKYKYSLSMRAHATFLLFVKQEIHCSLLPRAVLPKMPHSASRGKFPGGNGELKTHDDITNMLLHFD